MFDELEEVIQRQVERGKLSGLAIALVKGDEIVWSKGYGHADLESKAPVTPATVFSVQSVTKPVVATALMQWFERGRFQLDDSVNDHLGPVRVQSEWEDEAPVAIRHLLTHTSGLPVDIGAEPTTRDAGTLTLGEYVAAVAKTVRPPGGDIVYANYGYAAIGYLVQCFAGQPWDVHLRESVLEPLEMRSSAVGAAPEGAPSAKGYFLSDLDGEHHAAADLEEPFRPANPAGALFSTVEDLGRFLITHLNGGLHQGRRILAESSVAEMHRLQVPVGPSMGGMGLGFRVDRMNGRSFICHGGDSPGWTAFVGAYPEEKVGVALLINMGRAHMARSVIANAALRLLVGDYERHEAGAAKRDPEPGECESLTGSYLSNYWDTIADVLVEDGTLVVRGVGGLLANEEGATSYLERIEDGRFRAHDGFLDGFEVGFGYGEDGKAAWFSGGVYPIRFDRQGDALPAAALVIDEEAVLVGRWSGTCFSAIGALPAVLDIEAGGAKVTVLTAQDMPLEEFRCERGRVSGHFDLTVPGFGELQIILRLNAVAGGMLRGRVYARGAIGEVPMRAEFTRASAQEVSRGSA